jgi:hypothetical protein
VEVITNGTFNSDLSGWGLQWVGSGGATLTHENGRMKIDRDSTGWQGATSVDSLNWGSIGKTFLVTYDYETIGNVLGTVHIDNTKIDSMPNNTSGTRSFLHTTTEITTNLSFVSESNTTGSSTMYIDNISVREVTSFNKLIRDYPLDDNSGILRNRAAVLGGEELTNADFSNGLTGWTNHTLSQVINGKLDIYNLSNGFAETVRQFGNYNVGTDYLVTFDYENTGPQALIYVSPDGSYANRIADLVVGGSGTRVLTFTANVSGLFVVVSRAGGTQTPSAPSGVVVNSISIRQADGYGTVINGNDEDWQEFELAEDNVWLGHNKWDDSLVTYFSSQEQSEILGNGRYRIQTTGTGTGIRITGFDSARMQQDLSYRLTYTLEDVQSGPLNFSDFATMSPNTVGDGFVDITVTSARDPYIKRGSNIPTNTTISGIQLREVLNIP